MSKELDVLEKELNLMRQQKDNLLHKQSKAKTDNETKYWQFRIDKFNEKINNFTNIKQVLLKAQEQEKVLKIIFEKKVDTFYLRQCFKVKDGLEKYNNCCKVGYKLTQEEFELLKEVGRK